MINQAMLAKQNELNVFTKALSQRCIKNGNALVKLRNNTIILVEYYPQESLDEDEVPHFASLNYASGSWHLDGSSYTSYKFDIVASGSFNLLTKMEI